MDFAKLFRALESFFNVAKNDTAVQKAGSWVSWLAMLAAVCGLLSQVIPMFAASRAPVSTIVPAVVVPACTDAGCPPAVPVSPEVVAPSADTPEPVMGDIPPALPVPPPQAPLGWLIRGAQFGLALLPLGCSGPQIAAWKIGGADLASCLVQCGASAGSVAIRESATGAVIDGPGITRGLLGCAVPCLLSFGAVAIDVAAMGGLRYGGSAGAADIYQPDTYTIRISPR